VQLRRDLARVTILVRHPGRLTCEQLHLGSSLWGLKNQGNTTVDTHYAPSSFAKDDGAFFIVHRGNTFRS
jgi:hypothetical protein